MDSWLHTWAELRNLTVANLTEGQRYSISLYFAVVTMTTTGYGDIGGHYHFGFLAAVVAVILGMIVFAYALSVLSATLANSDAPKYVPPIPAGGKPAGIPHRIQTPGVFFSTEPQNLRYIYPTLASPSPSPPPLSPVSSLLKSIVNPHPPSLSFDDFFTFLSSQRRRAIEALEARPPQTVWRLWLIVYRTELKVSLGA